MNPHEWIAAIERLQRHVDPHLQSAGFNPDWDAYCEYTEPHGSSTGWIDPPCQEDTEDPDGEPLEEAEEEEEELASKMERLREIEEQILHKKAALAIKRIGLFAKDTTPVISVSCNEQAGGTLRDRVRSILLQHPHSFLSQVQGGSPEESRSSSRPQALHPLQLRVEALMKQRCGGPCALPASCEQVTPNVPSQEKKETSCHQGFQRFLSVLNKGVDIDMLSRILSDDREDLPLGEEVLNVQSSGALPPDHCAEMKTEPPSREPNVTERPDAEEKKDEHEARPRSESPQVVKKKRKVEKAPTKVEEQHEQLQNVLKSLGLSLELEEMSRLADRTQERLYGKKNEGRPRTDGPAEQETRHSHNEYRESSSSSSSCSSSSSRSSSSSSRSTSRSRSPSPRDSKPKCERRRPEEQRAQRLTDSEQTYQHPYPPHCDSAASVYPDHSLSQYSCYANAHSAATYSYWTYTVNPGGHPYPHHVFPGAAVPPNVSYPYPAAFHDLIRPGVHPDLCESEGQTRSASGSRCLTVIDTKLLTRQICPRKPPQNNPPKNQALNRKKGLMEAAQQRTSAGQGKKKKKKKKKKKQPLQQNKETKQPRVRKQQPEVRKQQPELKKPPREEKLQPEEEKRPLTEEEIKANLRKKLEAFNQKMKKSSQLPRLGGLQPAHSLASEIS